MASTLNYSSVDLHSDEDLELNQHRPTTANSHLSPFNHSQTLSNSASPYNVDSTPGGSLSEYSTYQPSELSEVEDPFFGVNFDAGVPRVDSIPTAAILGNVAYRATADRNRPLPPLPPQENTSLSVATAPSAYPLSPIHSSKPSTPSPHRASDEPQGTISPQELISGLQNSQFSSVQSNEPTHPASLQLTPDHSGSSHTSAEGVIPSTMPRHERSPHLTTSQWGKTSQPRPNESIGQYNSTREANVGGAFPDQAIQQTGSSGILRDEDGLWRSNHATGQAGLDPESRRELDGVEVPTLKEQDERRRIVKKNEEVNEWRSQAEGSDVEEEGSGHPSILLNHSSWYQQSQPSQDGEDNGIPPLDDTVSVHENRLLDGQVYFNPDATQITDFDINLMKQPRHWTDAPAIPQITDTTYQPGTAQEAIHKFIRHADSISIASRAATWGTRRRSEPSLKDFEDFSNGSFLKRLSITKSNDRPRQGSLLDGLANIVRKRSDSRLNKRSRSTHNISEESESPSQPRKGSQGTLAPPGRTSSFGRRHPSTPNINTASAFAAMAGPLAAVGATHARSGSISATNTSPKSPIHLGIASVFNRSRSKSDVSNTALVGLWRDQGGPPVAKLASQKPHSELNRPDAQQDDADDEDEEDDEQMDESDMAGVDQSAPPIVPNYEGFKAHVRALNPDMDPQFNWLVSRVAHQQEIRYKNLLDLRVKHSQALLGRNCASGSHCLSLNGYMASEASNRQRNDSNAQDIAAGLQLVTDFSDGSNPGEGALTDETFPPGVPMPPTKNLPDEFECQLCFKVKKFQKPSDWTKHVHEDVQPFTCTYEKCKEPKSFKRKADWVRHENERHRHLEWWICQVDDCRHPCYRKDNFLQHLVREHKLPEPKQKTKAAIKKARLTEPAWVLLEQCHHETQKRPQDEPCKFCGKSFPTWKKLTVHLAKHMEHISLPVLRLVESKIVDANTIISPVEQILTPVTPIGRPKMESTSPFDMSRISPHIPLANNFSTTGFENPAYFQTTGPTVGYGMQAQMGQGNYHVNDIYPNNFQSMNQPRGFQPLNSNTMGHIDQSRGFDNMHSTFHPKIEQQDFDPIDSGFPHMQNQQNFNTNPNSPYAVAQPFSAAPPVSNFQTPNILGINEVGYGFEPLTVTPNQGYQQVPMTRAQGSASSYGTGHSPQQNVTYYQ